MNHERAESFIWLFICVNVTFEMLYKTRVYEIKLEFHIKFQFYSLNKIKQEKDDPKLTQIKECNDTQ